jgi:photosystem II stability/assembly factor-like uncharacterized protein
MIRLYTLAFVLFLFGHSSFLHGQENKDTADLSLNALSFRSIGPAINGGRIADIDIHPDNENIWYVAVGSGHVWKTTNAGTTWTPIFDGQDVYSIGQVAIDPNQPNVIWVGTGEDVGGRHVAYGNGLYKSTDDGASWTHMGLDSSEHISTIIVHPDNSDVVYVCAEGPLWSSGRQRGLYKTNDGGDNWSKILGEGEWTGATDLLMDPRNPDILYAATWDRHRTVAAYMGGGPGTAIHKSTDGGDSWTKLKKGLPGGNLGKIGLALSPQNPDVIYAAIEQDRRTGGVYRSTNRGESWSKMSDAVSGGTGPHYYQELYASPHHEGEIILVSNYTLISKDHGANFERMNTRNKHVDDHAVAFRSNDPNFILFGCDGGLYATYDHTESWRFLDNLPIMQYYKISVDDAEPFYHVYGGTQDNGSNGGPSRTDKTQGITNSDWEHTLFADGHDSATEPGNPDIIYAETQKGGLHRVDRTTGEQTFIQPQPRAGEPHERYNWDAPIEINPHNPQSLYFASHRVWRSNDRGDSWTPISEDLTRNEERVRLPIMGRQHSWDNPWDIYAMSEYNTITSLAASPLDDQLLYAGTDDGLLHVTEDGGSNWRKIEAKSLPGVPKRAFVNDLKADLHDANTVYVALDNHKEGDYAPYLFKSTNKGKSWTDIGHSLPHGHWVWRIVQDHVNPELLFAGTEGGVYVSQNGGEAWTKLKGGMPTIGVRDLVIQKRENDLVAGTFGRGIYILDNYSPLRELSVSEAPDTSVIYSPRKTWNYKPQSVSHSQGDNAYSAPNPEFGATFTYYLKESVKTRKEQRKEREKELESDEDHPFPDWEELDRELDELKPRVEIEIRDENDVILTRVSAKRKKGLHRTSWNLRAPLPMAIQKDNPDRQRSYRVADGSYQAQLVKFVDGIYTPMSAPVSVEVESLHPGALPAKEETTKAAFREDIIAFDNAIRKSNKQLSSIEKQLKALMEARERASQAAPEVDAKLAAMREEVLQLQYQLSGTPAKGELRESQDPRPRDRLYAAYRGLRGSYGPTPLHRTTLEAGQTELEPLADQIESIFETDLPALKKEVMDSGAPALLEMDD